jgi:hypothetical protein
VFLQTLIKRRRRPTINLRTAEACSACPKNDKNLVMGDANAKVATLIRLIDGDTSLTSSTSRR